MKVTIPLRSLSYLILLNRNSPCFSTRVNTSHPGSFRSISTHYPVKKQSKHHTGCLCGDFDTSGPAKQSNNVLAASETEEPRPRCQPDLHSEQMKVYRAVKEGGRRRRKLEKDETNWNCTDADLLALNAFCGSQI